MIITVTPIAPDPAGAPIVLGDDDSGDIIIDPPLMPSTQRPAQIQPLARGNRQFAVGRGNRVTSFSWRVCRAHADEPTAEAFAHQHENNVPINCQVQISNQGIVTQYVSAVMTKVECVERYGSSTTFMYQVEGAVYDQS